MVLYGMYCKEHDITFVVKEVTKYKDGVPCTLTREVTGFYHGLPDESCNEFYNGKLSATYDL